MEHNLAYLAGLMTSSFMMALLVSRFLLWLTRSWRGGLGHLLLVHGGALVFLALLADALGSMTLMEVVTSLGAVQCVALLFDVVRGEIESPSGEVRPLAS